MVGGLVGGWRRCTQIGSWMDYTQLAAHDPNSFLFLPPGQTSNSASTIAHVEGQPGITTIVHVGDLSYAGAHVGGGAHAGRACAEVLAAAV